MSNIDDKMIETYTWDIGDLVWWHQFQKSLETACRMAFVFLLHHIFVSCCWYLYRCISQVFTLFNVLVFYLAVNRPFLRELKRTATVELGGEMDVFI